MTFTRLLAADVAAMLAALALLFAMGADWYSTGAGEEARRIERLTDPRGALGGQVERDVEERARASAEDAEKNAFQVPGAIDRVILGGLVATVALALAAAFLRAAAKRYEPPLTPSAAAAVCACATAALVSYRMIQQPGLDAGTTVKAGAPLGLVLLGLIALSCAVALRSEEGGRGWPSAAEGARGGTGDAGPAAAGEASIESTQ